MRNEHKHGKIYCFLFCQLRNFAQRIEINHLGSVNQFVNPSFMLTQTFCFIAKKGILKYNFVTRKLRYLYIYWFIFITPSMPYAYIKLRKFQKLSGFDSLCLSLWVVKGRFEYWTLHFLKYCRGGGSQIPEMILVCD